MSGRLDTLAAAQSGGDGRGEDDEEGDRQQKAVLT